MHSLFYKLYYTHTYIRKKYRQNTSNVDLSDCSNYYFSKIFGCFNHLEVRSILHYIIYKSFLDTAQ